MKTKLESPDVNVVGVIVARFQVSKLHQAHKELIEWVASRHSKTVVFLGLSPVKTTFNNPLDFESRKQMLLQDYPNLNVLYIKDEPSDEGWSAKLDNQISDIIGPRQKAILYGSRDSFISHYKGPFKTVELEPLRYISGTELRKEVSNKVKASEDFRAGVIWAVGNQYPATLATVDIAIHDEDKARVLLAKKPNETKYRFIGGFTDPNSDTYEADAKRETSEETGLETGTMHYIGSAKINDWRYKNETNKIKSLFFVTKYLYGSPKAADDISEVQWFSEDIILGPDIKDRIVAEHHVLVDYLINYLKDFRKLEKLKEKLEL